MVYFFFLIFIAFYLFFATASKTKESEYRRASSMLTSVRTKRSKEKMVIEEDDDEGEEEEEEERITLRALNEKPVMDEGEYMEVQEVSEVDAVRPSSSKSMSSAPVFGAPATLEGSLFGSAAEEASTVSSLFGQPQKPAFTDAASPSSGDLFDNAPPKPTAATGFSFGQSEKPGILGAGPHPFAIGGGVFARRSQAASSVQAPSGGSLVGSFPEQAAPPVSLFGNLRNLQQTELKPTPTTTTGTLFGSALRPNPAMFPTGMEACLFSSAQSQKTGLFGSGPHPKAGKHLLGSSKPAAPPGSLFTQTQQTQLKTVEPGFTGGSFGFGMVQQAMPKPAAYSKGMAGFTFGQSQQTGMAFGSVQQSVLGGGLFGKPLQPTEPKPLRLHRSPSKAEEETGLVTDGFASFFSKSNRLQDTIPATEEEAALETQTNRKQVLLPEFPLTRPMQEEIQRDEKKKISLEKTAYSKKKSATPESSSVTEVVKSLEPMEEQKQLQSLATPPPIPPRQQPRDKDSKKQSSAPVARFFSRQRRGAVCRPAPSPPSSPPPPHPFAAPPPPPSGLIVESATPFPPPPAPPPPPPTCPGGPSPVPPKPGDRFDYPHHPLSGGGPTPPRPTNQLHRNLLGVRSAKLESAKVSPELGKSEFYRRRYACQLPAKEEVLDELPNLGKKKKGAF